MMTRNALLGELEAVLQAGKFRDYAPNGLQVEGREQIHRIVTAVTASQSAIDCAIAEKADALLVHHGYFWKGEAAQITGIKKRRLQALLTHDINLIAYHLPLDQHPELGNNVLFGQFLGAENIRQSSQEAMLWLGEVDNQSQNWLAGLANRLPHPPVIAGEVMDKPQLRLGWCTGAAQDYLSQAACEGVDVFLTGEFAERSFYEAIEQEVAFIACGHHVSEVFGIRALGEYLQSRFALSVRFFDGENPF